jgi:hypothetical protein
VSDAQLAAFQAKRKAAEDAANGGGLGGFGGAQAKGGAAKGGAKGGAKPKVGCCKLDSAAQVLALGVMQRTCPPALLRRGTPPIVYGGGTRSEASVERDYLQRLKMTFDELLSFSFSI